MFLAGNDNSDAINKFLRSESNKRMAVAFIGAGLSGRVVGNANILCNLMSGATNPDEVAALQALPGVEVKNHSTLHAKVYVNKDVLIVGSSNLSTNGIGHEADAAGWLEASLLTSDHGLISDAQTWFDALWDDAEEITSRMISKARRQFQSIRHNRPHLNQELSALRDRKYYCVIYKDDELSDDAEKILVENIGNNWVDQGYGAYEQWVEPLPEGLLIEYHFNRGKLKYTGTFKYDGYSLESNKTDVQVAKRIDKDPSYARFDKNELKKILKNNLDQLWPDYLTEKAVVIPINQVLDILERA